MNIVELVDICGAMERRNLALFEGLGAVVTGGRAGSSGRLLAEACHVHAWHADLWAARRPAIPVERSHAEPNAAPARAGPSVDGDHGPVGAYRAEIDVIREMLHELAERLDWDLDPSTARVIELVVGDLRSISNRLDGRARSLSGSSRNS
ncbi:MAG: hypothetical protein ABIP17_05430 [Ilumatobacteraceae bacterium]